MSKGRVIALALLTLVVLVGSAWLVDVPGYTDADYYYAIGQQIGEGRGFQQPFIWNYLAEPTGLPQPAHLYWMPLTSILASLPSSLSHAGFRASQVVFIFLAAMLPIITIYVSKRLGGTERQQTLAGLLAIFPGFYLPFFLTTDAFALYALLGLMALISLDQMSQSQRMGPALAAGVFIGLSHLTRADGLLLLIPAFWAIWKMEKRRTVLTLAMVFGYLIMMTPWMFRMVQVSGAPLSPGASKALWLRNYDELFSYPADYLSPRYLAAAGFGQILMDRLRALATNLISALAVNHLIFLLPLTTIAAWSLRRRKLIQFGAIYLATLLLVMSFVFPFPGSRGGYFHSSTVLMPLIWALAPMGLDKLVAVVGAKRSWDLQEARQVLAWGMIAIAAALTLFLGLRRLSPVADGSAWGKNFRSYQMIGERLELLDGAESLVAVNNPPGYWNATGQPAVVIPDGDPWALLKAVQDYGVEWVVLEANHPAGLSELYERPKSFDSLKYIESQKPPAGAVIHIFQVAEGPG